VLNKLVIAGCAALFVTPSLAHVQSIYTPSAYVAAAGEVPVGLMLWHPMLNGPILDMAAPQEFYAVHRSRMIDLKPLLKPVTFTAPTGSGAGFVAAVPMREPGDYVLTLVPEPFLPGPDAREYIQIFTKAVVNRGQLPSDWYREVGLPAEILPLTQPYNAMVGSTFTGVVLSEGVPAPSSRVDIDYLGSTPDLATNRAGAASAKVPGPGMVSLYTDANGQFTFGLPRAGWWVFVAPGIGPETRHNGRGLSQDAAIWVYASEFGQ
jgi:cobalt/nickel transport protein